MRIAVVREVGLELLLGPNNSHGRMTTSETAIALCYAACFQIYWQKHPAWLVISNVFKKSSRYFKLN